MHDFSQSKTMAKALRKGLAERHIEITHADALELVARQFGFANWNMLAARIDAEPASPVLPEGWIVTGEGAADLYRIGLDPTLPGVIRIEATARGEPIRTGAFGTLMQSIAAESYRGGMVRISAELRSRGADRGGLWMR